MKMGGGKGRGDDNGREVNREMQEVRKRKKHINKENVKRGKRK